MNYVDYTAPTEQLAVIGSNLGALDGAAIEALAQNAMLLALGDASYVKQLHEAVGVSVQPRSAVTA